MKCIKGTNNFKLVIMYLFNTIYSLRPSLKFQKSG